MRIVKSFCVSMFVAVLILSGCATTSAEAGKQSYNQEKERRNIPASELYRGRPETVVMAPEGYRISSPEKIIFSDQNLKIILYAGKFAQGNAGYFEAIPADGAGPVIQKISFSGRDVPFTETAWGWRGFFAISPLAKPGKKDFRVIYRQGDLEKKISGCVKIRDVKYPVSKRLLDLGKFSDKEYTSRPEFQKLIKECRRARKEAFSSESEDSILNGLSHPRDMHKVTGYYWKKRIYAAYKRKGKRKVKVRGHVSYHRGLDLKGNTGAPVYSMADGKVVLAKKMFYEGNLVVVDHGNKVFSYYMHMDSMVVKAGDRVRAGEVIGGVGATGTVTGPHLHVALSIRGIHVHPLSILSLPVSR